MPPNSLDQFIEGARFSQRMYLYFSGVTIVAGMVVFGASFLPLLAGISGFLDPGMKLGGGLIGALSAFPVKDFLARRDRVIALTVTKEQLEIAATSPNRTEDAAKLNEIVLKIIDRGTTSG